MAPTDDERLTFPDLMALVPLSSTDGKHRFMSQRPSFNPGGGTAYGGHVFAQSVWAASFCIGEGMVVHNVHGFFTLPSHVDRPYIYTITYLSEGRSYCTRQVYARQPISPSLSSGAKFEIGDSKKQLGNVCFSATISFKRDEGKSVGHQMGEGFEKRYESVIKGRKPESWGFVGRLEAPWHTRAIAKHPYPNTFPGLDMRKVDMSTFNKSRSPFNYRHLTYYTALGAIPLTSYNLHACAHLYASDRNGLFLITSALQIGEEIGLTGSLSHSVVLHVESKDLVIRDQDWFCQEAWTPRSGVGRGIHESWIWDSKGNHIASSWQEGVVRKAERRGGQKQKLKWLEGMRNMGLLGDDFCEVEGLEKGKDESKL